MSLLRWALAVTGEPGKNPYQQIRRTEAISEMVPQFVVTDDHGIRYQDMAARWHGFKVVLGETEFVPEIGDDAKDLEIRLGELRVLVDLVQLDS